MVAVVVMMTMMNEMKNKIEKMRRNIRKKNLSDQALDDDCMIIECELTRAESGLLPAHSRQYIRRPT